MGDRLGGGNLQRLALIRDTNGQLRVFVPPPGRVDELHVSVGSTVAVGQSIATLLPQSLVDLFVGEDVDLTPTPWTADFLPLPVHDPTDGSSPSKSVLHPAYRHRLLGVALDVHLDDAGNLVSLGEFAQGFGQVVDGRLVAREAPISRVWFDVPGDNLVAQRTRPFRSSINKGAGAVPFSDKGERIIEGENGIYWFTNGGGFVSPKPDAHNHSRIFRFDSTGTDSAATPDDDRICAYHVPEDHNGVVGILPANGRIWFTESRTGGNPAISSFDPDTLPCSTYLDYATDDDVYEPDGFSYCSQPFAPGCITRLDLPANAKFPAHLALDPSSPPGQTVLWYTAYFGTAIGRLTYDLATGAVAHTVYPNTKSDLERAFFFGSGPWQIRVDDQFVYFSEWWDAELVRFEKSRADDPTCQQRDSDGVNPCMDELHLTVTDDMRAHSIDLRGDRLYFTMHSQKGGGPGHFGYVHVSDWRTGVVYTDMNEELVAPDRLAVGPASPAGISVNANGDVALADFLRRQVVHLRAR
ncbi:MAG: hypothetical protein MJE66_06310 [Proteobacteria bacterium]|nr:hypothetical protein [Pseudomonadota bacterium]